MSKTKKVVSLLLIIIILALSFIAFVFMSCTIDCEAQVQPFPVFKNRFAEFFNVDYSAIYDYDELYIHEDSNHQFDWALVKGVYAPGSWVHIVMSLGDVVISSGGSFPGLTFSYGIYDVTNDTFYDLLSVREDYSKYDGLEEMLVSCGIGSWIGDVDRDGNVTIIDATVIQRVLVGLMDIDDFDYIEGKPMSEMRSWMYSDFDGDNRRTILDATAIQRKLVGL